MIKRIIVILLFLWLIYGGYWLIDKKWATELKDSTIDFVENTFSWDILPITGVLDEWSSGDPLFSGLLVSPDTTTWINIIPERTNTDMWDISELQSQTGTLLSTWSQQIISTGTTQKTSTTTKVSSPKSSTDLLNTLFK